MVSPDFGPVEEAVLDEAKMKRVQGMCLCPTCPAYPKEDLGEKLAYCLRGKSAHADKIDPKDCYCENCEIYKHGRLYGSNFFCLEGAALSKGLRNLLSGNVVTGLADAKDRKKPAVFVSAGLDVHER